MVQPKAPTHLVLRGNTYHFRMAFPKAVRHSSGPREFQATLKTSYFRDAIHLANLLFAHANKILKELSWMDHGEITKLVKSHLKGLLATDTENRIMRGDSYEFQFPGPDSNMLDAREALAEYYSPLDQYSPRGDATVSMLTREMFDHIGMDTSEDSKDFKYAVYDHKVLLKPYLISASVRHNPVNYGFVRWELEDEQTETQQVKTISNGKFNTQHSLSYVFGKYSNERIFGREWKDTSRRRNEDNFKWLINYFGDIPIGSITEDMMRGLKDMLMSATARNAVNSHKQLTGRTIKNILSSIAAFFRYAKENKYIKDNLAEGLSLKVKKDNGGSYKKFTKEDLEAIFTLDGLDGRSNTKPWAFWVPVLALFTGCRLEEIAQLCCSDVKEEMGIWYLDLTEEGDKSLKTKSSVRKVPLHSFVVDTLKFVDFVSRVKSTGSVRLFSDLKKLSGKYGHSVSKWFCGRYLVNIGVKTQGDKKVFHSLRHTFITNLQHQGVEPNLLASIVGHESKLITIGTYGQEYKLEPKKNAIEQLDFGICMNELAQSRFVVK